MTNEHNSKFKLFFLKDLENCTVPDTKYAG